MRPTDDPLVRIALLEEMNSTLRDEIASLNREISAARDRETNATFAAKSWEDTAVWERKRAQKAEARVAELSSEPVSSPATSPSPGFTASDSQPETLPRR